MREDRIKKRLEDFNVQRYIDCARVRGRINVKPEERLIAASLYEEIASFGSKRIDISWELDITLELAERALFSEWYLYNNNYVPRYAAYTNLKILNWSLKVNRRVPLNNIWARYRRIIRLLIQDLTSFEAWSLAGFEQWNQDFFDPAAVRNRVKLLQALHSQVANSAESFPNQLFSELPKDWFSLALDESREVAEVIVEHFELDCIP
jgi:hypothetical protein